MSQNKSGTESRYGLRQLSQNGREFGKLYRSAESLKQDMRIYDDQQAYPVA